MQTRLTSLKLTGTTLKKTSSFQAAIATSGDEDVLTATASNGAAIGAYQLQVARLVSTQQIVSRGFADFNSTKIGAGTITCNYDGKRKHQTFIEDGVRIGSDTMLVAPVRVGRGSKTGAGAVVTRDVPPDSLAVGVPAVIKKKLE